MNLFLQRIETGPVLAPGVSAGSIPDGPYRYSIDSGYIIFRGPTGLRVLVDTGCPFNIGHPGSDTIRIAGVDRRLHEQMGSFTIERISEGLRQPIDILLGMDGLSVRPVVIDGKRQEITFGRSEPVWPKLPGSHIPTFPGAILGSPFVALTIAGARRLALLDTGAMVTYVPRRDLVGARLIERGVHDFFPGYGDFNVDIYEAEASIDGHSLALRVATLPPGIPPGEHMTILGNQLTEHAVLALDCGGADPAMRYQLHAD